MSMFKRAALAASAFALLAFSAHAEVPAENFGELPAIHDAAISPDGKRVAVFVNVGGEYGAQVSDISGGGGKPVGLLLDSRMKPNWIQWSGDDRILMSVTQIHDGWPFRTGAIYTFDPDTGKGDWLVERPRTRSTRSRLGESGSFFEQFYNTVVDWLPEDPDHILMSFADQRQFKRDLQKVNVHTGKYTSVERGSRNVQSWTTDLTGTARVKEGLMAGADTEEDYFMQIRGTDGQWRDIAEFPGIDRKTVVYGFLDDPEVMVIGARNGRDTLGLYTYDLRTKAVGEKLFHNDSYDVGGVVRDPRDGRIIGAHYTGDTSQTVLFEGHDDTLESARASNPGFQLQFVSTNDGGDTLLLKASNAYDPGMLVLQSGGGKLQSLGKYRPRLPSDEMGLVVPVRYTARDGQSIPSYVTLPPTVNDTAGIRTLPFVVLPHGGPFARDTAEFDWFAQFFASRGYGVLQMNFRGSTGYGESFAKAGRENWQVMRDDVEDGARWLVEKGYADPERMCVGGWSYGGYAALMSGVDHPELFSCVISVAGLSDLDAAIRDARDFRFGNLQRNFLLKGFESRDQMRANQPVKVAERMTLPTFIAHGEQDLAVEYKQHQTLRRKLKQSDADVTELTVDDDHYFSIQENRQKLMRELDGFLTKVHGRSEFIKQ